MESSTKSGWLTKDGEAPSEWPQGEREHQRDGKRQGRERSKADAAPEQNKCVWSC